MLSVFSVEYKIKRKFPFFGVNNKYILSCAVKISAYSQMILLAGQIMHFLFEDISLLTKYVDVIWIPSD